jgi:hypothetical protein
LLPLSFLFRRRAGLDRLRTLIQPVTTRNKLCETDSKYGLKRTQGHLNNILLQTTLRLGKFWTRKTDRVVLSDDGSLRMAWYRLVFDGSNRLTPASTGDCGISLTGFADIFERYIDGKKQVKTP